MTFSAVDVAFLYIVRFAVRWVPATGKGVILRRVIISAVVGDGEYS